MRSYVGMGQEQRCPKQDWQTENKIGSGSQPVGYVADKGAAQTTQEAGVVVIVNVGIKDVTVNL